MKIGEEKADMMRKSVFWDSRKSILGKKKENLAILLLTPHNADTRCDFG